MGAAYLAGLAIGYWKDIDELKENIKKDGLIKPLEVYQDDDHYILIGGHRRYNALLQLYMDDLIEPEIKLHRLSKTGL